MKLSLSFALLLLISACGDGTELLLSGVDDTKIITIGPYIKRC